MAFCDSNLKCNIAICWRLCYNMITIHPHAVLGCLITGKLYFAFFAKNAIDV